MTTDTVQIHHVAAPRSLVEALVDDRETRARWAANPDAAIGIEDAGQGVQLRVSDSADWSAAFRELDRFVAALRRDERQIEFSRLMQHPLDRVFAAFSNPAGMTNWWGPVGFSTTTRSMQFKVGGGWDFTMHGPDGTDYPNFVRYTEIEKNRRIAYDHGTAADQPHLFRAEILFAEEAGGTRVTLRLTLNSAAERPHFVRFGAVEGGYDTLARLDGVLAGNGLSH